MLKTILAQILPLVVPVIASFLFKLLNKGLVFVSGLNDWVKRIVFAIVNIVFSLGVAALKLAPVGDVETWGETTLVGLLTAVIAMLLYDNGKTAATTPDPVP